nr:hypothetical protein [Tanacetum cinerariifolium]
LIQDEDDLDRVIPDLRKRDREEDEDPSAGSNQEKRKRSSGKDYEPSNTSSASKKTSKGDTSPKSSKTDKSASTKESVKETTHEDPLNELMVTPIEFSNFTKNYLKLEKITKLDLVGPVYDLLKGTCQISIELEYNMKEYADLPVLEDLGEVSPLEKGLHLLHGLFSSDLGSLYPSRLHPELV